MVGETVGDQIGEELAAVDLSFAVFSDCGGEVASRVRYGDEILIARIVVVALQLIPNHVGKERVLVGFELFVEIGLVLGHWFRPCWQTRAELQAARSKSWSWFSPLELDERLQCAPHL